MSDFSRKWAESIALPFAQRWWAVALRGLLAFLFGIIALFAPGATILSLVLLFAAYAFVDGLTELYLGWRFLSDQTGWRRWLPMIVGGLASLGAAALALVWPGLSVIVFILLLGFWSFVSGVMALLSAIWLKEAHGRVWLAVVGVASMLFGAALAIAPMMGAVVLAWWIGVYALILSGALFALAYRLWTRRLR
jgi:uncharacterized membrane protein HdeD (DUF308 family)